MGKRVTYKFSNEGKEPENIGKNYNYKFIEPPIIVYFVTTIDKEGNVNVTPVTLGTAMGAGPFKNGGSGWFFSFSLRCSDLGRKGDSRFQCYETSPRDAVYNLDQVPECVISYCNTSLVDQVRVAGLPIPRGISELDVANLTPFESIVVKPPGIAECPVNMEAKVVFSKVFGGWKLYVCEIHCLHVDEQLEKEDIEINNRAGLIGADPIFELHTSNDPVLYPMENRPFGDNGKIKRLYFGKLDRTELLQEPVDIGPTRQWIGTFEMWMEDELNKGKIKQEEYQAIMNLYETWLDNPNPKTNGRVKEELTNWLKDIIWARR